MLYIVRPEDHDMLEHLARDPVRPHIPRELRLGQNRDIFALRDTEVRALTCVSYLSRVPDAESTLFEDIATPVVAAFYTIWSYAPGAGRELLLSAVDHIRHHNRSITQFVTLSPKTSMAHRFHMANGARVLRENTQTINYEYCI